MHDGFVIRAASPEDGPAIADVHMRTWQEAYVDQLPEELLDRLPEGNERRSRFWTETAGSAGPGALLVGELDGEIVGFGHVTASRDEDAIDGTGELTALYLRSEHWGKGFGRALLAAATERLRSLRFERATLWVLHSNERTQRFYAAAGWEPDGTEKTEEILGFEVREIRYRTDL
ncbi:MAG: GNAT family N-acetyltransferase [Actinomycetota bacterium]|nr:GNAT family N-acetyltransferase [Actinomycetota bacterium]